MVDRVLTWDHLRNNSLQVWTQSKGYFPLPKCIAGIDVLSN